MINLVERDSRAGCDVIWCASAELICGGGHARGGTTAAKINALLQQHITGRSLGVFGEPRVNVLALNLALQRAYPTQ